MPQKLSHLTSQQLDTLIREKTVFFLPVGPMEDHGPHLPLGLDMEEAEQLSLMAATRLEAEKPGWVGVVFPKIPLGIDSDTTQTAITVRPYILRDYLVDSCRSLNRRGFVHFVCFSGHLGPKQLTAIEEAGILLRRQGRWHRIGLWGIGRPQLGPTLVSANSALIRSKFEKFSPFWPDPKEHGGHRDTSVALFVAKDQVDATYRFLPLMVRARSKWSRMRERSQHRLAGYWGDPSQATATQGETQLGEVLDQVFPKLRAVWEGSNPNAIFRSWYSILPLNRSFFKAWLLALSIFTLICLWWVSSFSMYSIE
jgi:creatinine amidohydrolase